MKPRIDSTKFGSITISGEVYDHDVIIGLDGKVKKRKKKLSSDLYGTSHIMSLDEAKYLYEKGAKRLIVGAGQHGQLHLSEEAAGYFKKHECEVELSATPSALKAWNDAVDGEAIGVFHVTC